METFPTSSKPSDNRKRKTGSASVFPSFVLGNEILKRAVRPTKICEGPVMFQVDFSVFCRVSRTEGNDSLGWVCAVDSSATTECGAAEQAAKIPRAMAIHDPIKDGRRMANLDRTEICDPLDAVETR